MIGVKYSSAYCTSKFAINGYSQSLLAENQNSNLQVNIVYPGGIKTNITKNSLLKENRSDDFESSLKHSPEMAAKIIIQGIRKNKSRIYIGSEVYKVDFFMRFWPSLAIKIINKYFLNKQLKN